MNDTLSDAIKEAYTICPSDKVTYETLEIRQDGVQNPIYIVKSRRSISAFDENGYERVFEPVGFEIIRPASTEEGIQTLNVVISNVGRRFNDFVVTAKSRRVPVLAIYRAYLSDDLTIPQTNPPLILYLKDLEATPLQVTGRATFMDVINRKFPSEIYSRDRFPALD